MALKALEIDPGHKESAYNYGMSLLNLACPEQAVVFIAEESARHSDYPLLMALQCVLYLCVGESASAKAISEKLRAGNYALPGYIQARITALEQLGHLATALQLRNTAISIGIQ